MSYKEISIWASVVITVALLVYYLNGVNHLIAADSLNHDTLVSLLYRLVIIAVIAEVILQTVIAAIKNKEANLGDDERDKLIDFKSNRISYWLAASLIIITVFMMTQIDKVSLRLPLDGLSELSNFMHMLIIGFWVCELSKYLAQLYYYRKGC